MVTPAMPWCLPKNWIPTFRLSSRLAPDSTRSSHRFSHRLFEDFPFIQPVFQKALSACKGGGLLRDDLASQLPLNLRKQGSVFFLRVVFQRDILHLLVFEGMNEANAEVCFRLDQIP